MDEEDVRDFLGLYRAAFDAIARCPKPVVAAINGVAFGGGLELALFCNWIFASPDARLGQPEIMLGVFPPPASIILPLKVGQARADHLCLTGESWTAETAQAAGLVHEVAEDPMASLDAFARRHLVPKSASSLRMGVRAARMVFNETLRQKLPAVQKLYLEELMETADANEGIGSFLEKRKPAWKHA